MHCQEDSQIWSTIILSFGADATLVSRVSNFDRKRGQKKVVMEKRDSS
jgi:hypothetical protein